MATAERREANRTQGTIPYRHVIDDCLAASIGDGGLSEAAYRRASAEAAPVVDDLRARRDAMPLLGLPDRRDDLAALAPLARDLRDRFDDLVVLGAGGSSLGGQTLCALAGNAPGPRLDFADNIDPASFAALLEALDLRRAGFLAISKSGATPETLAQTLVCLEALRGALGDDAPARHLTAITQPGDSPLRRLAARFGIPILDHDPGIAGRFSVLSLTGLLPALIAGVDARGLRDGARAVLEATLSATDPRDSAPVTGAAIAVGLARERGIATTVLMPYADALAPFGLWYRQLWAESLGKDGAGTTPAIAMGTTDQHSQLQLYLDGPRDKMFTLITLAREGAGPRIPEGLSRDDALAYLEGKTVGDLMAAAQRATAETLARRGRPVRAIHLERLDEPALGALLMHFMLETIIAAGLMGVDAFDQPAVDRSKALARAYLSGQGAP